jgi:hypothetical protein
MPPPHGALNTRHKKKQMNTWTVGLAGGLLQEKGWTYVKP